MTISNLQLFVGSLSSVLYAGRLKTGLESLGRKMRVVVREGLQFALLVLTFCVMVKANQGSSEVTGRFSES